MGHTTKERLSYMEAKLESIEEKIDNIFDGLSALDEKIENRVRPLEDWRIRLGAIYGLLALVVSGIVNFIF